MNNTPTKPREFVLIGDHNRDTHVALGPALNYGDQIRVREILPEQEPPTAPPCHLEARMARLEGLFAHMANPEPSDAPQAILAQNTGIPQEWDEATKRAWHEWVTNPNGNSAMANLRLEFCKVIGEREELKAELRRVREVPAPFDEAAWWAMIPPWFTHRAMDEDGKFYAYSGKPWASGDGWRPGAYTSLEIPAEHAPPRASDWTQSLTVRPGLEVAP